MNKTLLITPNGERFVVLPEEEYERLVEDAADVTAYDRSMARIAAGEDEAIPAEVMNRLIDGPQSRMRVWRDYRGLSLSDLATATGFGTAYLSQIETGKKSGSIDALTKIAKALRVDVDDLLPAQSA